ncbi:hypothetical protein Tco_1153292 [Tanacetum coccineum]
MAGRSGLYLHTSTGGNVMVLYASVHHDIPIVVNVSGRYKMDMHCGAFGKRLSGKSKKDGFIDIKSKTGNLLKARESKNFSTLQSLANIKNFLIYGRHISVPTGSCRSVVKRKMIAGLVLEASKELDSNCSRRMTERGSIGPVSVLDF